MKNKTFWSVFCISAVIIGLTFTGQINAQKVRSGNSSSKSSTTSKVIASPQSILIDDFTYTPGQLTDAAGGANVSGGLWVTNTGTGSFLQVSAGSLTYSGYPSSGVGNKLDLVSVTTSAEDTYRSFTPQTAATTYAAFMVNVANTTGLAANSSTTGDYFAGFSSSSSTTAFVNRVTIRAGSTAGTFQLGLRATGNAANTVVFSTTDYPVGTTVLVVISYQIVSGTTNDVCNMWVNPTLGPPEPAATLSQVSASDNADIGKIFFRQGNAGTPNASVDGVRIANSWASIITEVPLTHKYADFNGDGKTDWAITRSNTGLKEWWIQFNGPNGGAAGQFGLSTDRAIPADFDGDGKADIAVWREAPSDQAAFYIFQSSTGTVRTELFGQTGDSPKVVADYDLDGKADVSVYRPGAAPGDQSYFYYRGSLNNPTGIITYVPWGTNGDTPTVGDFDGDGKADFCVRRDIGGQGTFILLRSSDSGVEFIPWGLPTDAIVPGDYDGDGKSDFCLARVVANAGNFYILERDGGGTGASPIVFGDATLDQLAPGDYDGDGKTDIAVWRANADPTQNYFWVRQASNGNVFTYEWGQAGDEAAAEWNVTGGN